MALSILEHIIEKAENALIPLSVHLEITRRCNLDCKHCCQVKSDTRPEMAAARILRLIDELRNAGCLYLLISGGEPLMRRDFLAICRKAHKSNLAIYVATNGTLIDEHIAKQLSTLNIMDISLSVYGAQAKTHDGVTRKKGSFEQTMKSVKLLKRYGLAARFKFIMMKDNMAEYESMVKMANQLSVPYDLDPIITPCDNGQKNPIKYRLDDGQLGKIYQSESANLWPPGNGAGNYAGCSLGKSHCAISAYGDVYPCIQLPLAAGNINEQSFGKIWRYSRQLKEIREYSIEKVADCKKCAKKIYCRRCPGLAFVENGDMFSASSEACRHAGMISRLKQNRP
ncbi:MAG: radical SAM protein [Planctomycetota bacterium]